MSACDFNLLDSQIYLYTSLYICCVCICTMCIYIVYLEVNKIDVAAMAFRIQSYAGDCIPTGGSENISEKAKWGRQVV